MFKAFLKILSIFLCIFFISTIYVTPMYATSIRVLVPYIIPVSGTYTSSVKVNIYCIASGATIRYTTNGSEPTSSSTKYTGTITISSTTTIKAKAFKSGYTDSLTASATYTIKPPSPVATPKLSPSGGTYTSSQKISISCSTSSATIRYTTNGSEPTSSSTKYSGAITVSTTTTIKAKAFKSGMTDSNTASATYVISPYTIDTNLKVKVSVTARKLDDFIKNKGTIWVYGKAYNSKDSPLVGLGQLWIDAGDNYSTNSIYLMAHAICESGWGFSSIAKDKHNLYGYGAYDPDPKGGAYNFSSYAECIDKCSRWINSNYLISSGKYHHGATLKGMNVNYATDQQWASKIANIMNEIANYLSRY